MKRADEPLTHRAEADDADPQLSHRSALTMTALWHSRAQRDGSFVTRTTNVSVAPASFPWTRQQPTVGNTNPAGTNPVGPYPRGTSARSAGAGASTSVP